MALRDAVEALVADLLRDILATVRSASPKGLEAYEQTGRAVSSGPGRPRSRGRRRRAAPVRAGADSPRERPAGAPNRAAESEDHPSEAEITDPQALLSAVGTRGEASDASASPANPAPPTRALREHETIARASAAGLVIRRRRAGGSSQ